MKRILYIVGVLVFLWLLVFWTFRLGKWRGSGLFPFPGIPSPFPVFVGDTIEVVKYREKRTFVDRIIYKEAKVETVYVVKYEPWMDSVYAAITFDKQGSKATVVSKKDKDIRKQIITNVPNNFEAYGTKSGFVIRDKRFRFDWIKWRGIRIGCKNYFTTNFDPLPYAKTGFDIKWFTIYGGIDKNAPYWDASFNLRFW